MEIPVAQPGKTRIGWIGTGVMGRWMCQHAMKKGYAATVYNRSQDKAQPLVDAGAKLGEDPEGGRGAVGRRVRHRRLPEGRARGVPRRRRGARRSKAGHGAGGHDDERAVAGEGDSRGGEGEGRRTRSTPRCPGGDVGAKNAALSIMIGGDKEVVAAVQPLFECMGKTIVHQGAAGRRPAHEDGEPDPDLVEHDRGVRGAAVRLQGGPGPGNGVQVGVGRARPGARRWRCWGRGSWPATSSRASTSSTSSRTWASRWPKRRR